MWTQLWYHWVSLLQQELHTILRGNRRGCCLFWRQSTQLAGMGELPLITVSNALFLNLDS